MNSLIFAIASKAISGRWSAPIGKAGNDTKGAQPSEIDKDLTNLTKHPVAKIERHLVGRMSSPSHRRAALKIGQVSAAARQIPFHAM